MSAVRYVTPRELRRRRVGFFFRMWSIPRIKLALEMSRAWKTLDGGGCISRIDYRLTQSPDVQMYFMNVREIGEYHRRLKWLRERAYQSVDGDVSSYLQHFAPDFTFWSLLRMKPSKREQLWQQCTR